MDNVLISVIVPAYNIAPYLEKSIASIQEQSYKMLEIIIVDDGSKDETLDVARKIAEQDSRVRVIHKENGGVTSARLCGIAEAKGEWIGFVDGDDYIEPRMYERLLGNALTYGAEISHCGYQMVFPKGHIDYYRNSGRLEKLDRIQALSALIEGTYIEPSLCNKLFHKHLFCRMMDEKQMENGIRNTEDLLMNYYLFREAKVSVYEDFCPYHYMLRPSSAATSKISEHKLKDPEKVLHILLKENENEPEVYSVVRKRYARLLIQYSTMDCRKQEKWITAYRQGMRAELRKQLPGMMKERTFSWKLKLMALWAGLLPGSYGWVHRTYEKLRGFDRIYDLDK